MVGCKWKPVFLVLVVFLAAIGWAGCGTEPSAGLSAKSTASQQPVDGGTLVYSVPTLSSIDPAQTSDAEAYEIVQALFDGLTQFDYKTNKVMPAVASSWEKNADATVWTFHLKKGTTFHNGREVVAQDFKYAWERIADPASESPVNYHLAPIVGYDKMQSKKAKELSGVKVLDKYTLQVTLKYSFADFDSVVAHPCLAPVPKEAVEKDPSAYAMNPVGNGPFRMAESWKPDQYAKVVRYEGYSGNKPHIAGIEFRTAKDPDTAFLEFKAGTLDVAQIPDGQIAATKSQYGASADGLTANPGSQTLLGPELSTYYLDFNNKVAPFNNANLRRAISLAINRQAICDVVFEGSREPADDIIPQGMPGYVKGEWAYSHYDQAQAKTLLAKAGYPNGKGLPAIKLSYVSAAGHEEVMQLVQADLKAIGIAVHLDGSDGPTYGAKLDSGNFQMVRDAWTADYPIADNFINSIFSSTSDVNAEGYSSAAVDQAIVAARQVLDPVQRVKAYEKLSATIGNDSPVVPLVFYSHRTVCSARLHNFTFGSLGLSDFVSCWISTP